MPANGLDPQTGIRAQPHRDRPVAGKTPSTEHTLGMQLFDHF